MRRAKLLFSMALLCGSTIGAAQIPSASIANTPAGRGIQIVSANYGTLGRAQKLDIAARLQAICGPDSLSCQVFCSETSFGRYALGKRPICRVMYSCDTGLVRSVEAEREEPILMRCPETAESYLAPPTPAPMGSDH